jgi:hypothetical protein
MNNNDVTEITCDGCTAASDWYCVKCWNGLVADLHFAEVQRDAARQRVAELEQLLALRAQP